MERLWDLLTFIAVLLAPSMAVIAYFVFYRPVRACQDFMYGKYGVHWTFVGVSLAGCFLGPITLLWPSELFRTGTTWLLGVVVALLIAVPIVAIVHLPVLHYNRSCSIYQYLEDRFRSRFLKYFAFAFNALSSLLFCVGVLTLSAELAQQSLRVTIAEGYVKRWICILVLSALTGTSAALGGQKAAVFLSSFTLFVEFIVALICAVAMALYKSQTSSYYMSGNGDDSGDNANDRYGNDTGRGSDQDKGESDWFPSLLTPEYRLLSSSDGSIVDQENVWLTTSVCLLYFFYVLGCQQTAHQHYCSVPTKRRARFALLSTVSAFLIVWSLSFILACLMINFYAEPSRLLRNCFSSTSSSSSFHMLADPYSALKRFFALTWANTNGASGYFLGCFTCVCAFCYLPSAFVSLATSAYEDLVKPYYCINAEENRQILALKTLTAAFASATTIGALLLSELLLSEIGDQGGGEGQLWWLYTKNVCLTLATWTAPLAALYVLAIWLPCTNAKGAIAGVACGLGLALTLCFLHLSQFPYDSHVQQPSSLLFGCCDENASIHGFRRIGALMGGETSNYTDNIIHEMVGGGHRRLGNMGGWTEFKTQFERRIRLMKGWVQLDW